VAPDLLIEGPAAAPLTVALAHGAGAGPDAPLLAWFAAALAARGYRVVRFAFPYMAQARQSGVRRPPDRPDVLLDCWRQVIAGLDRERLVIGGKSMGGRMASLIADAAGVRGLLCFGYPFHPPGRADRLRIAHLATLRTPALILQGERDPFGTRAEVAGYPLSPAVRVHFIADADHGLTPRAASGVSREAAWSAAAEAAGDCLARLQEAPAASPSAPRPGGHLRSALGG
jgi:hypothetical protein